MCVGYLNKNMNKYRKMKIVQSKKLCSFCAEISYENFQAKFSFFSHKITQKQRNVHYHKSFPARRACNNATFSLLHYTAVCTYVGRKHMDG